MAIKIPVPVLWDKDNNFLGGALISADGLSLVVGTVLKPDAIYPPAATPTLTSTLQIKEPNFGTLYLDMPLSAWLAAIRAVSGTSGGITPRTLIYNITSESDTIVDSSFDGATILAIWKNGSEQDIADIDHSGDTLTFPSNLEDGDTVGVIFYVN